MEAEDELDMSLLSLLIDEDIDKLECRFTGFLKNVQK